jgi:hypothetical protein
VRRTLSWAVTLPLTAAGVLCAHAVAYRALGVPSEGVHGYLAHAPQLIAVLGTVALAALVVESRTESRSAWPFAAVALSAFACQEHVERLVHTGELPWLLTRPVFLLGLALQVPVALAVWLLARLLLRLRDGRRARPPRVPVLLFALPSRSAVAAAVPALPRRPGRDPPVFL